MVLGIVVRLRFMSRPVAVPVMAKLVIKGSNSKSRLWLARRMAERLAAALPGREIRVVADSAYAGGELKGLPARISWTTRLRKDAALHGLPPARTGRPGRIPWTAPATAPANDPAPPGASSPPGTRTSCKQDTGQGHLGNYLSITPGELRGVPHYRTIEIQAWTHTINPATPSPRTGARPSAQIHRPAGAH